MTPAVEAAASSKPVYANGVLLGILILLCHAPAIRSMVGEWLRNEDMGHGFFVPIVAGYLIWQQRDELIAIPTAPNWFGLLVVLWGATQSLLGVLGAELFLSRSAVIVTLAGAVWMAGGNALLRKLAFPLFLLCFMVPIPAVIFNAITFPLQLLASRMAEHALSLLDVPVLRQGNVLELPSGKLSVVEACSGIRSLLSLTFLSLVYGRFFETKTRMRLLLFAATPPIAILANGGRVTVTGLLAQIKPELAEGFFHESTGWVVFIMALGILVVFHRVATRLAAMAGREA